MRYGHAERPEMILDDVGREPGLPLVEVHRDEVEVDRAPARAAA